MADSIFRSLSRGMIKRPPAKASDTAAAKAPAQKPVAGVVDFFQTGNIARPPSKMQRFTSGNAASRSAVPQADSEDEEDDVDEDAYSSSSKITPDATSSSGEDEGSAEIKVFAGQKRPRAASIDRKASTKKASVDDEHAKEVQRAIEEINGFRKRLGIRVTGNAPANPMATFDALMSCTSSKVVASTIASCGVGSTQFANALSKGGSVAAKTGDRHSGTVRRLLHNIEESQFKEPTPIQMESLSCMMAGRDLLGIAPTGSGKTAAFGVPIISLLQSHDKPASQLGPRAIILTPVKELAQQTLRELTRLSHGLGLKIAVLTKAGASGAAGDTVSAGHDAGDLVRLHKQRQKEKGKGKRGAHDADGEEDADEHDEEGHPGRPEEAEDDEGEVEEDEESYEEDGEDEEDDEDDEGEGSFDEDEDEEEPEEKLTPFILGAKKIGTSSSGAAPTSQSGTGSGSTMGAVVIPSLPHVDILITTPLILVAALRHAKGHDESKQAIIPSLKVLVCDEADKLLELGFLEQVDEILSARPTPETVTAFLSGRGVKLSKEPSVHVQCALFSATMPSGIEELAMTVLRDPLRVTVGLRDAANTNVDQKLVFVGREEGKLLSIRQMIADGLRPPVLVFVQSKERAIELHKALSGEGYKVDSIHADKSPAAREDAIKRFRTGETWMLIATDLLGRGMDFKGINVVINYDFPQSAVAYVHRIGRTGRAGRAGRAITYFTESDIPMLRTIANIMRISGCDVPDWMLQLKKQSRRDKKKMQRSVPRRHHILVRPKKAGHRSHKDGAD